MIMTTYEAIKSICDKNKIAVTALEESLGFGRGTISRLKNGGDITSGKLKKIADYFGVSTDYILNGEGSRYYINQETADIAQEVFENKDLRLLFDAARDSDPDDITTIHHMLLALKRKERKYND